MIICQSLNSSDLSISIDMLLDTRAAINHIALPKLAEIAHEVQYEASMLKFFNGSSNNTVYG